MILNLVIATLAALSISTAAFAQVERPTVVVITPTSAGSCSFTLAGITSRCRSAVFMEDRVGGHSNFMVEVDKNTVVSFRGGLAYQRGLTADLKVDAISVGTAPDLPAPGTCNLNITSLERPDVKQLRCTAYTPRGPISFTVRNATADMDY